MNCKKCGIRLNNEWTSCPACGTPKTQELVCKKCGFTLNADWKNCPGCGAEIEKDLLCEECGFKLEKHWNTCPNCGRIAPGKKACAHCGRVMEESWLICPDCGKNVEEIVPEEEYKLEGETAPAEETAEVVEGAPIADEGEAVISESEETIAEDAPTEATDSVPLPAEEEAVKPKKVKMKWYKFLKFFGIWAAMIAYASILVSGILKWLPDIIWDVSNGELASVGAMFVVPECVKLSAFSMIDAIALFIVIATAGALIKKKSNTQSLMSLVTLMPLIIFTLKQTIEALCFVGLYGEIPLGVVSIRTTGLSVFLLIVSAVALLVIALLQAKYFKKRKDIFNN